jgi:hypothetical protein
MGELKNISPSENILKLRKLTEQICSIEPDTDYVLNEIRTIIDSCTEQIISSKTEKTKLKYYEKMFSEIKKTIKY